MKNKAFLFSALILILVALSMWYFLKPNKPLFVEDLSGSYDEIFDQLQSIDYDIGLYGDPEDKIIPASVYLGGDKFISLQETILKSYFNRDSYYSQSPRKIGKDIYFTSKNGLYKIDVLKRTINQIYKDDRLIPASFVEPTEHGTILTGWSISIDPSWGNESSGVVVETDIITNKSKVYPFTIPEVPHLKVSRTFGGVSLSRNGKFIWVYSSFSTTDIDVPKRGEDSQKFDEFIELINTGRHSMINRATGEIRYISFTDAKNLPQEDLLNLQGWPGHENSDPF